MYETKTEDTAKNISVLLEPILLVIVWLGVVAVAVAVILPLYSLLGSLNTSGSTPPPVVNQVEQPTPSPLPATPTTTNPAALKLKIKATSVGYLNVRIEPSLTAGIIKQVSPGETFEYLKVKDKWYEIVLCQMSDVNCPAAGESGWVFGDYVEEIK